MADLQHAELTQKIIGCAYAVHNKMGFGFQESVYEKCMLIELEKAGLKAIAQQPVRVFYEGRDVGDFAADLLVEDKVIVELKSVRHLTLAHEAQLVNYLVAMRMPLGLLINFGEERVEVKRKVKSLPVEPR